MTPFTFDYRSGSTTGRASGVSFAQALDRAKIDYLRQSGVSVKDPQFRLHKSRIRSQTFRLALAPQTFERYVALYRGFQEGQLTQEQLTELRHFQQIIKDKDVHNAPQSQPATAARR